MGKPAGNPSDQLKGKIGELLGEIAPVEKLACEHERRQRQQRDRIDCAEHVVGKHHSWNARAREGEEKRGGEREAEGNRYVQEQKDRKWKREIEEKEVHSAR